MTTFWCELAWLGAPDGAVQHGVRIEVEDERITEVNAGTTAPVGSHRLAGLTLPGFANAHSHAFHRALRGRTHAEAGSFWTWRERMYALADRLDPDSYRALATATFAEMVLAGYTCVGEFHYLHHDRAGGAYRQPNEMGEVLLDAAAAAGIRITLLDTCYLQAGMMGEALSPTQQRFSDGDADAWATRVSALASTSAAQIGAAIHSVRSVGRESMTVVAEWAAAREAPLHAHVSEQPAENEQCSAAFDCTPTELLDHQGVLGRRFTAVHATHLLDHDVELFRSSRSTCCICATTERDLADGIGPTGRLRAAGIPITIGSDSHAVIDPFEETRGIELDERLASLRRGTHQPAELLSGASQEGYRSLGWPEGGRLAVGCLADFTTVALSSPRLAGLDESQAAAAVVFAGTAADVSHVVVGGRVIVAGGAHQRIDVAAELDRSVKQVWS